MTTPELITIGWRERVHLPEWDLRGVRAKIDTGARTSAIDVAEIEELGDGRIRFEVVGRHKPERLTRWITATPTRESTVKPSHGEPQRRFVCTTTLRIGEHEQQVELSLVCRRSMLCRMLIGRTALEGRYLVDPGKRYLLSRGPRKKKARTLGDATEGTTP